MIQRIVLHNWKSHYKTVVEFEPGTNVVIGINGAGKSSVLEAIYFALFGPPEKKNFYERILRDGEKEGYVELSFTHNGKTYTVKRWFDRKRQKGARLEGAEKVITSRPKDVDEKIVEILGMDGKTFRDAVYARQNEMASILLDGKRRKELIDEMIEISEFSRVRDTLITLRNRLRDWIRGAESLNYEERIENLNAQRKRKEESISKREEEMEKAEKDAEQVREALAELEKRAKRVSEEYRRLQMLRARLQQINGQIQTAERKIAELLAEVGMPSGNEEQKLTEKRKEYEKVKELERKLTGLLSRLEGIKRMLEEKRKIIAETELDPENIATELAEREEELSSVEKKLKEKSAERSALEAELRSIKERIAELKQEIERSERILAELREIREKYGNVEHVLEEKRKRIQEISDKLVEARSRLSQEREFVRALEGANRCPVCGSELGEKRAAELKVEHEKEANRLKTFIETLERDLKEEEKTVEELQNIAERIIKLSESIADLDEKKARLKELDEKRERIVEKLEELKKELAEIEVKRRTLLEAVQELRQKKELAARIAAAKEDLKRLELEKENTEKDIKKTKDNLAGRNSEKLAETIKKLEKRMELLRWVKRRDELANEGKNIEVEVKQLKNAEEEYQKIISEKARLEAELRALQSRIASIRSEVNELRRDIEEIDGEIRKMMEQKDQIERRRKILNTLNRMIPAVEMAREQVRELRIRAINKALNIVWRGLYPRRDLSEIRLRPESSDYILEVKREGKWIPVTNLSGGEFYDAALALRIAISALKAKDLGLLILDEPTHNLDVDATEALAHILNKLPQYGLFRQIIVITHDEALQKAATGTIYVFERDKDRNRPTEVRKLAITHEI